MYQPLSLKYMCSAAQGTEVATCTICILFGLNLYIQCSTPHWHNARHYGFSTNKMQPLFLTATPRRTFEFSFRLPNQPNMSYHCTKITGMLVMITSFVVY